MHNFKVGDQVVAPNRRAARYGVVLDIGCYGNRGESVKVRWTDRIGDYDSWVVIEAIRHVAKGNKWSWFRLNIRSVALGHAAGFEYVAVEYVNGEGHLRAYFERKADAATFVDQMNREVGK